MSDTMLKMITIYEMLIPMIFEGSVQMQDFLDIFEVTKDWKVRYPPVYALKESQTSGPRAVMFAIHDGGGILIQDGEMQLFNHMGYTYYDMFRFLRDHNEYRQEHIPILQRLLLSGV